MMKCFSVFLFAGLFLSLSTGSLWAANPSALLESAVERLDYRFFYWLFEEEDLQKAYALAQEEDFEATSITLFTDEMLSLFKVPQRNWEDKLGDLDELWYLEEELKTLSPEKAQQLIQEWRYAYLSKMMAYMRRRAGRKPVLKFLFGSKTSYDTNIIRADDVDLDNGTVTGEEDGQQMFLLNAKWMPMANHPGFSQENKFSQSFNMIRIHQFSHKDNQVMIFDTESKWTRKIGSEHVKDFSLGYRLQNFGLSGDPTSRDTHSKFFSHRIKGDLNFSPVSLGGSSLKRTQTMLSLSYILKNQLNDADTVALNDKDATDLRFSIEQSLDYKISYHDAKASAKLEFVDYSYDDFVAGDYDYWKLVLKNKTRHNLSFLKEKLRITEEFGIRNKGWGDATAPIQDEVFMWLSLNASTRLSKGWDSSLSLRHAWRERDSNTNTETDANQTVIALGFIWSTP